MIIDNLFNSYTNKQKMTLLLSAVCEQYLKDIAKTEGIKEDEVKSRQKLSYILNLIKDVSVGEASSFCFAMQNAVDQMRREKNKDLKVKDLDIELLPSD